MCYSAIIRQDYKWYAKRFGAQVDIQAFIELFWRRRADARITIPKGMEDAFMAPESAGEEQIKSLIDEHRAAQMHELEQDLFKQRKRLADAQRALLVKTTKTATNNQDIAGRNIEKLKGRIDDLQRVDTEERDQRIFPGVYAPLMVMENGKLVIKPMRYQCRPPGCPASYDVQYSGSYNARRDNLKGGFWKNVFGHRHGLMVASTFLENVKRHRLEGRELADGEKPTNVVLRFDPQPRHDMLVACIWSHWSQPGQQDLLSFAAVTDEPPDEVAAAGHDRCIVALKPNNVDAWLSPDPANLSAVDALLGDPEAHYYEHALAA